MMKGLPTGAPLQIFLTTVEAVEGFWVLVQTKT
jgi:hypothetical protein